MFAAPRRPKSRRPGVTLIEMLVVVVLVVLMMLILVQIFQVALGAMAVSRTTQELDATLRSIDSMIRSDLAGVTAKMTPPNDPALKSGYFEYGENAPADPQGEDTDDFLAFTTKAPEGQFFSGRQYLIGSSHLGTTVNNTIQPITITSELAEVIYFLRNGNLYRRVLLIAPQRQKSVQPFGPVGNPTKFTNNVFQTSMFGASLNVSWQGMNDLSARPGGYLPTPAGSASALNSIPILNDLGDLTNRENRRFSPRFHNDFSGPSTGTARAGANGDPDDGNADGVPDYWPTLYYDGMGVSYSTNNIGYAPNLAVHEAVAYSTSMPDRQRTSTNPRDVYAFPFIYPGMYSVPDKQRVGNALGWAHQMFPNTTNMLPYHYPVINHSPLDVGDTLSPNNFTPSDKQTWWGFPTWRETMSGLSSGGGTGWLDPVISIAGLGHQANGLGPFDPTVFPISPTSATFLPPLVQPGTTVSPPFSDGAGSNSFIANPAAPTHIWEDDLIMTGVRSFDVKAYDPDAPLYNFPFQPGTTQFVNGPFSVGYQDLGYGSAGSTGLPNGYNGNQYDYAAAASSGLTNGGYYANGLLNTTPPSAPFQAAGTEPMGFGHEGRIPPKISDYRFNPTYGNNIGDDHVGIIRLTHTFDTWSTDYTNAPATDILLNGYGPGSLPIYPSFPPPYPSALRGIQIQIRVVDSRNERPKVLTIRHDFTDKLTN